MQRTFLVRAARFVVVVLIVFLVACSDRETVGDGVYETSVITSSNDYNELLALFDDWREFARPRWVEGVPDYSASAMAEQQEVAQSYHRRLAAIDESEWPVAQQIDHHLVRAEMNGLDFDHRVRRPWATNPAFYVTIFTAQSDVPAHEGPVIDGWLDTWTYQYPLDEDSAAFMAGRIGSIPRLLENARENLTGNGRDLWVSGARSIKQQSRDLAALGEQVAGTSSDLDAAIVEAGQATNEFAVWIEREAENRSGLSGVGSENYTWYLKNVHLVPYTWEQEETILLRELARAHASLRLEENRNRGLAVLSRIDNVADYDRNFNEAVDDMITFLEEEEIFTMADYMGPALRARIGSFSPADGLRGFFSEIDYRDPLTMRTHGVHWIDLARMEHEPHESPMRRVPALSNIYDNRSEGLATGFEEMMMHAGLFDDRPRARELIWILLAQRAARGLGGLRQHANVYTLQEAAEFASEWTPRGFLPADGATIQGEEHFYLTQPGYGTSYIIGKLEIEKLMAERAIQLGNEFTVKRFFNEFLETGVIPVSLVRWQLTGKKDAILDSALDVISPFRF